MTAESIKEQLADSVSTLANEISGLAGGFKSISLDDQDAQTQATAAANSATAAANSATAASTSESNAAASATAAANSASGASTSASNAATSESNAANSATTASNSASSASSSASTASTAASNASTAASNAQAVLNRINAAAVAPVAQSGTSGDTLAANTTKQVSATFTAPADGYVMAFGQVNLSSQSAVGLAFTLKINSTTLSSDQSEVSQSHSGFAAVTSGTVVTITFSGTNSDASTASPQFTMHVGGFFIPSSI